MGRSLLSSHGIYVTGRWWKGAAWNQITGEAPDWVIEEAGREVKIPKGVGPLSFELLRRIHL